MVQPCLIGKVSLAPVYPKHWNIRVTVGPHGAPDHVTSEGFRQFLSVDMMVSPLSNRTDIRLGSVDAGWVRQDGGEACPSNFDRNLTTTVGLRLPLRRHQHARQHSGHLGRGRARSGGLCVSDHCHQWVTLVPVTHNSQVIAALQDQEAVISWLAEAINDTSDTTPPKHLCPSETSRMTRLPQELEHVAPH